MTRTETAKIWAERMQRFEQIEMTIAQFCAAEGVSQPSFYNWRKKLRSPSGKPATSVAKFVPVTLQVPPVQTCNPATPVSTTIQLPGGVRICVEVPRETSPDQASQTKP